MYTDPSTRPETGMSWSSQQKTDQQMGKRDLGFIATDSAVFFPRLVFEMGKSDRNVINSLLNTLQGDFPLHLAVKGLPKSRGLWFRTRTLGVISNLVSVAT